MTRLQGTVNFESLVTAGLTLVGLYLVAEGVSLGLGSISVPEAGSFTFLAGVALVVLGTIQLFVIRTQPASRPDPAAEPAVPGAWHKVLALFAALAIYTAVLDLLGFIVSTILLSAAIMKISHRPSWTAVCLVSVGASVTVYVVFDVLLGVSLPSGTLFER